MAPVRWMILLVVLAVPLVAVDAQLLDDPPLRVGYAGFGVPAAFDDNGTARGFGVDIVNLAALKTGATLEYVAYPSFNETIAALRNQEVDVVAVLAHRPDLVGWAVPSSTIAYVDTMFVTANHPEFVTVNDIQGRVSSIVGSPMEALLLRDFPHLEYVAYEEMSMALNALARGELDAYFGPLPVIGYESRRLLDAGIRPVGEPIDHLTMHVWANGENLAPLERIEEGLERISPGEASVIFIKWTGFDLGPQQATQIPRWVSWGAGALGAVAAVAGAWVVVLRRAVESRTKQLAESRDALVESNSTLEQRIKERTAKLDFANAELQHFVHSASHDLRAPLRHMRSYAELLAEEATDLDAKAQRYVDTIVQGANRMGAMLDALLTLSRAGHEQLDPAAHDVAPAIRDLAKVLGIDVRVPPEMHVVADPVMMRIVFQNLLDNAKQYGADAPVAVDYARGDATVITVANEGQGFDMQNVDRMWEPFTRLQSNRGTGIGLATVQRIVERHGGTVAAFSAGEGKGAQFTITLPNEAQKEPVPPV